MIRTIRRLVALLRRVRVKIELRPVDDDHNGKIDRVEPRVEVSVNDR